MSLVLGCGLPSPGGPCWDSGAFRCSSHTRLRIQNLQCPDCKKSYTKHLWDSSVQARPWTRSGGRMCGSKSIQNGQSRCMDLPATNWMNYTMTQTSVRTSPAGGAAGRCPTWLVLFFVMFQLSTKQGWFMMVCYIWICMAKKEPFASCEEL